MKYIIILKGVIKGTSSWIELNRSDGQSDSEAVANELHTVSDEIYQGMKRTEHTILYFGNCSYRPSEFAALKVETIEVECLQEL
jgi:hypothetical protein